MTSLLPPSRPDVDPNEPGESLESVPWESLRLEPRRIDRRTWYIVAGVVAVVAVVISAVGRLGTDQPIPPTASIAPVTTVTTPTTTTSTDPVMTTEADLMAFDPVALHRLVMAYAETAVAEYFAGDAGGVWQGVGFELARATFVERVTAVEVTPLHPGRLRVLVAASVLDGDETGRFERRALRGMTIDIDTTSDRLRPVDLPAPSSLPFGVFQAAEVEVRDATPRELESLSRSVAELGVLDEASVVASGDPASQDLRFHGVVVDVAGNRWPVAMTLNASHD